MSPQPYTTEATQQTSAHPTSPWTDAFWFSMTDRQQVQSAQPAPSWRTDGETQAPTQEALSDIYNRGY
jgi:hypothetical protein